MYDKTNFEGEKSYHTSQQMYRCNLKNVIEYENFRFKFTF